MSLALPSRRLVPAWVRNDLWRRARAVPSLDLRFADRKSLVDGISGQNLITFTRASSGTYVDSAGVLQTAANNEPRFDHNPSTGESLGLLVEEQRTNLLLRSGEISISFPWGFLSTAPSVTTNSSTAPDGTLTATRVTFAAADSRVVQASIPVTSGVTYTLSVYARPVSPGTLNKTRLAFFDGVNQYNQADITLVAGWQRVSLTVTAGNTGLGILQIRNEFSASVANDIYIWGAQLEVGAFPTSYIPTTGTAATRAADVASITGPAFSAWYRQSEGAFYVDLIGGPIPSGGFPTVFSAEGSSSSERIQIVRYAEGRLRPSGNASGAAQFAFDLLPAHSQGTIGKVALAVRADSIAGCANGGSVSTDDSANMPTPTQLFMGTNSSGSQYFNSCIRRFTYWPQRLPNTTLQALAQ